VETNGGWEVGTEAGFIACYRATFPEVYAYAGMLCGSDRDAAEDLVHDVYLTALHRARDGDLTTANVGYFITSVRRRHIDRWRSNDRERQRLSLVHSQPSVEREPEAVTRTGDGGAAVTLTR
jgi:DNA-directed RNA polymerase specialized sigma24 family protein